MEHWDFRVCRAWSELTFGTVLGLSACVVGTSIAFAFVMGLT